VRVTIIKADDMVYVDGLALSVDCSMLPDGFHALQWYDSWGEIETNVGGQHANQKIDDLSPYQFLIDAHAAKKIKLEEAAAAAAIKSPTPASGEVVRVIAD
jgi:hypothetical protein